MRGGRGGHNHFMSKMWKKKKKLMAMKGALDEEGVPIKSGPGKKMPQHVCLLIKIRDFNVFCLSIFSFDLLIMYTLLLN